MVYVWYKQSSLLELRLEGKTASCCIHVLGWEILSIPFYSSPGALSHIAIITFLQVGTCATGQDFLGIVRFDRFPSAPVLAGAVARPKR